MTAHFLRATCHGRRLTNTTQYNATQRLRTRNILDTTLHVTVCSLRSQQGHDVCVGLLLAIQHDDSQARLRQPIDPTEDVSDNALYNIAQKSTRMTSDSLHYLHRCERVLQRLNLASGQHHFL